ncbi:MAG: gliding motility-associated ABC transporter permease subunit GldF [Bacteroidota bacterium]
MFAIFKKEINSFFNSIIGYLVVSVFLLISGLFLWSFTGSFNIFDIGYANLTPFFELAAWILIFLVPAIAMKSFSEEKKQGTLELIYTKPITGIQLILGKFFGNLALVVIAILPSLIYIVCINYLVVETNSIDYAAIGGSYIGLILLSACYTAISLFSSSISSNQIVSFVLGVLFCFLAYFALEGISNIQLLGSNIYALEYLSLNFHYKSMSRGVLDTRNIIFFISIVLLFLGLTKFQLEKSRS